MAEFDFRGIWPEHRRGDADERAYSPLNGNRHTGIDHLQGIVGPDGEPIDREPDRIATLEPVLMSKLVRRNVNREVLWKYLPRNSSTLLSAYWKAGKTEFIAHLMRALAIGDLFLGDACRQSTVLILTEENHDLWCDRRDRLGLTDHLAIIEQPFRGTPPLGIWRQLIDRICEIVDRDGFDLVIFDTLFALWCVSQENDSAEQKAALLPLDAIKERATLLLSAHLKKGDAGEGTGTRGGGFLMSWVDQIIELRRTDPHDITDPKRELSILGRFAPPSKLIIEYDFLSDQFRAVGDEATVRRDTRQERKREKAEEEQRQLDEDRAKVIAAVRELPKQGEHASVKKIRGHANLSEARVLAAVIYLMREKQLRKTTSGKAKGQFGSFDVYHLPGAEND